MAKYKLYYFNITGLAEPIRYLLHYCGVPFEDFRFKDFEEWTTKFKPEMPMEQVPILEINGVKYHQHLSICKYIAKKFHLLGSSEEENLEIDAFLDDVTDMRLDIRNYFNEKDELLKPILKEKMMKSRPFYLDKFESLVIRNNGFFFNGRLTLADIYYAGVCEVLSNILGQDIHENHRNLKKLVEKIRNLERIKAYIDKRPETEL